MTAKEKAKELVEKYDFKLTYLESKAKAKQCALIAVDEILNSVKGNFIYSINFHNYWKEVKHEIEKL